MLAALCCTGIFSKKSSGVCRRRRPGSKLKFFKIHSHEDLRADLEIIFSTDSEFINLSSLYKPDTELCLIDGLEFHFLNFLEISSQDCIF